MEVLGPTSIQKQIVDPELDMALIKNVISSVEATHLLELAEGRWQRSLTTRGSPKDLHVQQRTSGGNGECLSMESATRTSYEVHLKNGESAVVDRVLARVATLTGQPLENIELPVLLRYRAGDHFEVHHDGSVRNMTFVIYLNDVPEGGETYFPKLGLKIRPVACSAVTWRNNICDGTDIIADPRTFHAGLPPAEGYTKYVMVCFVNANPMWDASYIKVVPKEVPSPARAGA